jgi:ABC-type nitrate/sulfonate/bicarbonate transport system substrate-binding protein
MMRRFNSVRSVLAAAAVLAVLLPLGHRPAAGQNLIAMKVLTGVTLGARSALYAQSAGIFRKYGLDVDIVPTNSGSAGLSAVVGGSAQVVYLNTVTLVEAAEKGVNLQVVAPGAYYSTNKPYALIIVRKDSPIRTARDLNGKIIAAGALKDINAICTLGWIDQNGGDSKTVRTIEVPNSFLMPALDEGRIDATTILPPFQTVAIESGKYRAIGKSYDSIAKNFELAAWVATGTWASENPEAVRRFAAAMREASIFANANPLKAVDVVAAFTKIDPAIVARSVGSNDPPYVEPADIQPVIDASLKYGIIQKNIDAAALLNPAVRRPGK